MREYPQSRLIKIDAYSAVVAWLSMAVALLAFLALLLGLPVKPLLIAITAVFLIAAVAHVSFALAHNCPDCLKHPTIQGFSPLHPSAIKPGIDGWAHVVLDVVKRDHFTCIHCGAAFRVSGAA